MMLFIKPIIRYMKMTTLMPPYRLPQWRAVLQKLWMRVRGFLIEAVPIILGAILVINMLDILGIFGAIGHLISDARRHAWIRRRMPWWAGEYCRRFLAGESPMAADE